MTTDGEADTSWRHRAWSMVERVRRWIGEAPPAARLAGTAVAVVFAWWLTALSFSKGLPLGIIVRGVVVGSLYALLAAGVILIWRANRIVNFAQAELGSVAAVLAIELVVARGWNYFAAIVAGFAISAVTGGVINVLVIRRFRTAPRLILAVATIGLAQILNGIAILIPLLFQGLAAGRFTTPFSVRFSIHPVVFDGNYVMAIAVAVLAMGVLAAFLRFTDYGVAIRAAAENGDRANLLGVPVPRLSTVVWVVASLMSAAAVMLRVPLVGFASFQSVSGAGNALLLRTLAVAVIARMESLPRAVVGAIVLGVVQEAASWELSNTDLVDGLLVLVILAALLIQRDFFTRAAETGISTWKSIREVRPVPREMRELPEVRIIFGAVKLAVAAVAVTLPFWAQPSQESAAALLVIYAIVAVSLLILTGWAGHISLGQFALVGFGGATTALLYGRHGWDYMLAMPAGMVVAALVALVIGLPALRIKGPFLAVTTLAFGVTAESYLLEDRYFPWFIQTTITRPKLWDRLPLQEGWQIYFLSLFSLVLVIIAVRNMRESRIGRAIIAVRDNESAAESVTMDATRIKLVTFMASGAIAGFAGGLYVLSQGGLHTDAFGSDVSLRLFSMVVIGGLGSLPGAVLGAVYVRGVEFFLSPALELISSGFGILILLLFVPDGLGGIVYRMRDAILRVIARRRGLVVPSLLADRRVEQEDATIGLTLPGSGASPGPGDSDADEGVLTRANR